MPEVSLVTAASLGTVTVGKIHVWNLTGPPHLLEIEIRSLELAQFRELHRQEILPLQDSRRYFLSFSSDNRYLAIAMENVVTVLDAGTLQIIGQSVSSGSAPLPGRWQHWP